MTPADVGQRVTVQYFTNDGTRTEAVGVFERAERVGEQITMFVRRKDDVVVEVPLHRVKHGKVIRPPRAR